MSKTQKAMSIEFDTLNNIADTFFNEDSKFLKNLESVKGPLYNPITHDEINVDKEIQILAQAKEITDPRFVMAKEAKELHLEMKTTPEKIGVTHTSVTQNTTTDELDLKTFSYSYINAKDIPEILKTRPVQFSAIEKHKIFKNLENRVLECEKQTKLGLPISNEMYRNIPEADRQKSLMLLDASSLVNNLMNQDKNISSDKKNRWLRMTGINGTKLSTDEFITRETFKSALSASLLARELGENPPLKYILKDQEFKGRLYDTYIEPKNGLKKLERDINKAKYTKSALKIFVLEKEKVRKSKEEIKAMEEEYKKNPSGKKLSSEDYYTYKSLDIEPFVIKMVNDKSMRAEVDKEIEEKEKTFTEKMKSMGKMFNPHKIRRAIKKMVRSSMGKNIRAEIYKRGMASPALTTVSRDMAKNAQKNKTHKKNRSRSTGRE